MDHDRGLFATLLDAARATDPDARAGAMFGCPAVYHGRKLAACVFGGAIGLKIPAAMADAAVAQGRAVWFTPYGRKQMKEWVMVAAPDGVLDGARDLLVAALAYARENGA